MQTNETERNDDLYEHIHFKSHPEKLPLSNFKSDWKKYV